MQAWVTTTAVKTAAAAAASVSAPAPAPPPAVATSSAVDVPQADCVLVLNLTSESAARKLRWRLAETGLGDRVTVETENQKNRLRATGINAAAEERIHQILKEYPKLELQHCVGAPPVLRARAEER